MDGIGAVETHGQVSVRYTGPDGDPLEGMQDGEKGAETVWAGVGLEGGGRRGGNQ